MKHTQKPRIMLLSYMITHAKSQKFYQAAFFFQNLLNKKIDKLLING